MSKLEVLLALVDRGEGADLRRAGELVSPEDLPGLLEVYRRCPSWEAKGRLMRIFGVRLIPGSREIMLDYLEAPGKGPEDLSVAWGKAVALCQLEGSWEYFMVYYHQPALLNQVAQRYLSGGFPAGRLAPDRKAAEGVQSGQALLIQEALSPVLEPGERYLIAMAKEGAAVRPLPNGPTGLLKAVEPVLYERLIHFNRLLNRGRLGGCVVFTILVGLVGLAIFNPAISPGIDFGPLRSGWIYVSFVLLGMLGWTSLMGWYVQRVYRRQRPAILAAMQEHGLDRSEVIALADGDEALSAVLLQLLRDRELELPEV